LGKRRRRGDERGCGNPATVKSRSRHERGMVPSGRFRAPARNLPDAPDKCPVNMGNAAAEGRFRWPFARTVPASLRPVRPPCG
jgi:hypothetical protein